MSYSADARQLAVKLYRNSGWSQREAAEKLGISARTLQEWVSRDKAGDTFEDRPRSGHPRRLEPAQVERLLALTREHTDWTQQQYADQLNAEFTGLSITQPGVSLELKRARISLKKKNGELMSETPSVSES